jgi:hypothetical protein
MQPQRTTPPHPTPTPPAIPAVLTVNGRPVRDYLHTPAPEPVRWLVGDVDGWRVVWTPDPRRARCARHAQAPSRCRCVAGLAGLADPAAVAAWWATLRWRERRRLHTAALTITGAPARPRWEPPTWTWGLGRRLILAAAALALLLLLAPLLHR